jgi:hypothetical protein
MKIIVTMQSFILNAIVDSTDDDGWKNIIDQNLQTRGGRKIHFLVVVGPNGNFTVC